MPYIFFHVSIVKYIRKAINLKKYEKHKFNMLNETLNSLSISNFKLH